MSLTQKTCVPCQGGIPPLTPDEAGNFLGQVPGWEVNGTSARLKRKFTFDDFVTSLDFVNKVGAVAEEEGHHPDISFGWGYAHIVLFTHKIQGLHENDFIMAAKISELV
jgi:4a-hydroxytetrahydrobiopterin dehydratase